MLGDVVDERPEAMAFRTRRQMKRLSDFQTLLQITPSMISISVK